MFAYLAQGKLYIKAPGTAAKLIESQYVENATERARKAAERNAWKSREGGGPEMLPAAMLWGNQQAPAGITQTQIRGITRGADGEVMFSLDTNAIGGLFAYDLASGSERRLFHKAGFRGFYLAKHPQQDLVALSVRGQDLSAHIALTDTQGHRVREITDGDCVDESPSWVPGSGQKLLFQSAGIGRDASGAQAAVGPARIEQLDIESGRMETLAEDERFDHLSPRRGSDGALYFIRRPYSASGAPASIFRMALDALLFPFRLARAFVHFFNFFSMVFSKKPLLTSGGPEQSPKKVGSLMLWGKVVDAEKALKAGKGKTAGLVPRTWELVRQDPSGTEDTLARGIVSFDLTADGSVVFTDGSTISCRDVSGQTRSIGEGKLIEQVTVLGT